MAGLNQISRISQILRALRTGQVWRRARGLGPLGVTLAVMVVAVLLLGPGGVGARLGASPAKSTSSVAAKASLRIARADAHAEYTQQGKDLELNLALSQTQNDCQAPLNGGVCLRYSVVVDEQGVLAGYGVIPASAVTVTPGAITLRVDTRKVPGFVNVVGTGALIVATWKSAATVAQAGITQRASAQGAIGAYTLPSVAPASGVNAASGASVIATMFVR